MEGADATTDQIVISQMEITNTVYVPGTKSAENNVNFVLNVKLNHSGDADDHLVINVYVGDTVVETVEVAAGTTAYSIPVTAPAGAEVKAVISGTQNLERGVYFYQPKPQDIDGDGIATSREVSQNLIGVANGETPVYAEAFAKAPKPTTITFNSGDASNISFMLIDKATGAVEFLYKIDIENQTSFEIPTADGKISAVFVKQSTSGMFWFAEEVEEDVQNAVIDCLKANNPSYKGYNAIAFGAGDHDLEFKKNKFVTYTFDADSAFVNNNANDEKVEVAPETDVESETETEAPEVSEPETNEKKNNNKNKNKNKNK